VLPDEPVGGAARGWGQAAQERAEGGGVGDRAGCHFEAGGVVLFGLCRIWEESRSSQLCC